MFYVFDLTFDREVNIAANSHDAFIPPRGWTVVFHAAVVQRVSVICEHVFQCHVQSAARLERA